MRKNRKSLGFTMAEMLIVVAIIAVLSGVSFIAVQRYQRSMAQLERDAIAKEIFVAAQNHLTVAEGQGFLNIVNYGAEDSTPSNGIYYFISNGGDSLSNPASSLLDLMLPFGSVDETVRLGGNFVVRYQLKPATVMDVFYCPGPSQRFGHNFSSEEYSSVRDLSDTYSNSDKRSVRRSYGDDKSVIGWYGGDAAQEKGSVRELNPPEIKVINAERLLVKVTDKNSVATDTTLSLKLIIRGEKSEAMAAIPLGFGISTARVPIEGSVNNVYTVVLDDVTLEPSDATWNTLHFAQLNDDSTIDREGTFLPGENITISAVTCGKSVLSNIVYSGEVTTNSLFADLTPKSEGSAENVAQIANLRHLENLGTALSGVKAKDLNITSAAQLENLTWDDFTGAIQEAKGIAAVKVKEYGGDRAESANGCYLPIHPEYALDYDGQGHWIDGVKVGDGTNAHSGDGGLFAKTEGTSKIANLALVNFDISATGSAGALAGVLNNTTVENVVAYSGSAPAATAAPAPTDGGETPAPADEATPAPTDGSGDAASPAAEGGIASSGGSAGGLVGTMNGGSVTRSAAALYVSGATAGGLIGSSNGASFTASYSGGHTNQGEYKDAEGETKYSANISATGTAGGLIGSMTGGTATGCYSTCSVSGATAGGMAGSASGGFTSCYATGLVTGTTAAGAFAGTLSGTPRDCLYLEIINERIGQGADEGTVSYLPAVSGAETTTGITAADASAATYASFMGDPNKDPSDWVEANPYDLPTLQTYYGGKYPLMSLERLNAADTLKEGDFVKIHYGDWPVPELFVEN